MLHHLPTTVSRSRGSQLRTFAADRIFYGQDPTRKSLEKNPSEISHYIYTIYIYIDIHTYLHIPSHYVRFIAGKRPSNKCRRQVMEQWHDIILQDVALSKPSEAEEDWTTGEMVKNHGKMDDDHMMIIWMMIIHYKWSFSIAMGST